MVFDEIKLPHITLKNRIVRSAFQTSNNLEGGLVPPRKVREYGELAKNGLGLIITGQIAVTPTGMLSDRQDMLYWDAHVAEQKKIADAVHENGGRIVAQLNHSGAKTSYAASRGIAPLAPSDLVFAEGNAPARAVTVAEIAAVTDEFAAAAGRAKAAGYDGVQIHAAHSYLLGEFMSPFYNKRTDAYGGSVENRFRIVRETAEKIRAAVGEDYPVFIKMDCNAAHDDAGWAEDVRYFIRQCEALGLSAVELSGFDYMARGLRGEHCYFIDRAAALRKQADIPIMLVGGIRSLEDMERVLAAGIDMVSMARPFCCEPDLLQRLEAGQPEASCVNCNLCFAQFSKDGRNCVKHGVK